MPFLFVPYNLVGLIHTDDKIALKDAARQLQLENVVGDKVFVSCNMFSSTFLFVSFFQLGNAFEKSLFAPGQLLRKLDLPFGVT